MWENEHISLYIRDGVFFEKLQIASKQFRQIYQRFLYVKKT